MSKLQVEIRCPNALFMVTKVKDNDLKELIGKEIVSIDGNENFQTHENFNKLMTSHIFTFREVTTEGVSTVDPIRKSEINNGVAVSKIFKYHKKQSLDIYLGDDIAMKSKQYLLTKTKKRTRNLPNPMRVFEIPFQAWFWHPVWTAPVYFLEKYYVDAPGMPDVHLCEMFGGLDANNMFEKIVLRVLAWFAPTYFKRIFGGVLFAWALGVDKKVVERFPAIKNVLK